MFNDASLIREVNEYFNRLFPICRSLTGDGTRKTLDVLQEIADFEIIKIPSGTFVYDWKVPDEWNIGDAYIKDSSGNRIVDFKNSNLHVVNYSIPTNKKINFIELEKHLHYLPNLPNAIPYRTSYYNKNWGFCLTYNQFKNLDTNAEYEIKIDSEFKKGYMLIGESVIKGDSKKEYLFSSYDCHPSMANDNLSGMILWALLLRELHKRHNHHNYRFVIAPETIGAIAYLKLNEERMKQIDGGFVISNVAGPNHIGYKSTYLENHYIDEIIKTVLKESEIKFTAYPFDVMGSDERQYSSPAFRIPMGVITSDGYYEYKEYHTSLDDLDFINIENLIKIFNVYKKVINRLEIDKTYISLHPNCEAYLNKYKLYPSIGASNFKKDVLKAIMNIMFWSDGKIPLSEISKKSEISTQELQKGVDFLISNNLLKETN